MDNLKDGVYKATANGYHDLIHVEVYITDGKIEKIEYKHKDTPDTGGLAIQHIVETIVDKQSLEVERVSGARYSSIGILTAVTKAVQVAQGKLSQADALKVNTQETLGEYSQEKPANVITKMSEDSISRLRLKGGSVDIEQVVALLNVFPYELLIYNRRGRLDFVHATKENSDLYNKIGLHILDVNEDLTTEKIAELREKKIAEIPTVDSTIMALMDAGDHFIGYAQIYS